MRTKHGWKNITPLIAVVLLAGCSTPSHFKLDSAESHSAGFTVIDNRAPDQKIYQDPSILGRSEYLYGDENFTPDRLAVFKTKLGQKLGDKLTGKTVIVNTFEVKMTYSGFDPEQRDPSMYGPKAESAVRMVMPLMANIENYTAVKTLKCEIAGSINNGAFEGMYVGMYETGDLEAGMKETINEAIRIAIENIVKKSLVAN